jgi:hypothetical protein
VEVGIIYVLTSVVDKVTRYPHKMSGFQHAKTKKHHPKWELGTEKRTMWEKMGTKKFKPSKSLLLYSNYN